MKEGNFKVLANTIKELQKYKKVLLAYCKLDTLAMIIIFKHWETLLILE